MSYDPHKSSLHLTAGLNRPELAPEAERQKTDFEFRASPGGMPTVVLPHRGVTIRTIQSAIARHARENGTRGVYNMELEGVHIGRLTVQV